MHLKPETFHFLIDLSLNNDRTWFEANRSAYEAARTDFINFVQFIIDSIAQNDTSIKDIKAKDCLFRINRDTRFSKNKAPYKTNFGASINFYGRKSMSKAGYYIHLEPAKCFYGGGLYMPPNQTVEQIRQLISRDFTHFQTIINESSFIEAFNGLSFNENYTLKKLPKGFDKDDPAEKFLKLKSFLAIRTCEDEAFLDENEVKKMVARFKSMVPFVDFINKATHT